MEKFKTLEEAQAAYDALVAAKNKEVEELKKQLDNAESVAKDAIEKVNAGPATNDVFATVDKKKYKILFGVDGKTKQELAADSTALKRLVKIGSGAIELVEG